MVIAQCFGGQSKAGLWPLLKGKSQKTKAERMVESHTAQVQFFLSNLPIR